MYVRVHGAKRKFVVGCGCDIFKETALVCVGIVQKQPGCLFSINVGVYLFLFKNSGESIGEVFYSKLIR